MKPGSQVSKRMASLAAGALLAALPLTIQPTPVGPALGLAFAHAKDGNDDSGGDDHGGGRGGDDHGGDDRGGSGGRGGDDRGGSGGHGSDDSGGDDRRGDRAGRSDDDSGQGRGRGRGGDDHGGDRASRGEDNSGRGRGRGGDDSGEVARRGGDDARRTGDKVEITPTGIEVVHADGTKEEIRNGRYERKDASGRTVEERPSAPRDFTRLSNAERTPASGRSIRVGFVTKVEAEGGNLEVLYSTGWKEELENGRYELKDPNNNTVVERPARQGDIARLQQIAGR